jgi:hypothetical protein
MQWLIHHKSFTIIGREAAAMNSLYKNTHLRLQQKLCTKAYHIICSLCRFIHVKSNAIEFFFLWFFYDLLWFFKYSAKINIKEKPPLQTAMEIKWPVLREEGETMSGFRVEGGKAWLSRSLREAKWTFSYFAIPLLTCEFIPETHQE